MTRDLIFKVAWAVNYKAHLVRKGKYKAEMIIGSTMVIDCDTNMIRAVLTPRPAEIRNRKRAAARYFRQLDEEGALTLCSAAEARALGPAWDRCLAYPRNGIYRLSGTALRLHAPKRSPRQLGRARKRAETKTPG